MHFSMRYRERMTKMRIFLFAAALPFVAAAVAFRRLVNSLRDCYSEARRILHLDYEFDFFDTPEFRAANATASLAEDLVAEAAHERAAREAALADDREGLNWSHLAKPPRGW